MSLGPTNCPKDLHIVINDTVIEQKSEIMLLGVTLDDQLSFSSPVGNASFVEKPPVKLMFL